MIIVAHRVAGARVAEADRGGDVAGAHLLDLLALVGVHLQHAAHALALVLGRVVDVRARLEHARVHAEERQLPDERIGRDLERERRERRVVRDRALGMVLVVMREVPLDRLDVDRRREVVDHRVEQRLDALVLERGAAEHGNHLAGDRRLADRAADLLAGQLFAVQVLLHHAVVVGDGVIDQLVARQLDRIAVLGRHVDDVELLAQRFVVEDVLLALDDVDVPGEQLARSDGELERKRVLREAVANHRQAAIEVGADAIHLVGEDQARHAVAVGLSPDGLGLRLDAGDGIEERDGAVEHAERALDFDGEVDVSRRVDDVDAVLGTVARPERGGRGGRDRDAALLLLLHPIHRRGAFVHLADLVRLAGIVEDALGRSRLTGIDVGHDADIAIVLERCFAGHMKSVQRIEVVVSRRAMTTSKNAGGPDPSRGRYPSAVAGCARRCCASGDPRRARPDLPSRRREKSRGPRLGMNVRLSCVAFREPQRSLERVSRSRPLRHAGP